MSDAILTVEGAVRRLSDGERQARIAIDRLTLRSGSVAALCGPSGLGKTTAIEMLSLARNPDELAAMTLATRDGETIDLARLMAGRDGEALTRIRGRHFGYVVQTTRLFPFLTVAENVVLPQRIADLPDHAFAEQLMMKLGIADLAAARPADLSGGQRQRVAVARALAHRPRVVLADEPTSAVDRAIAETIVATLLDYAGTHAAAVLVITHNTALVREFGLAELSVASESTGRRLATVIADPAPEALAHRDTAGACVA